MNKIRVIDLLNKIANGEEVPEKIIYRGYSFKYHPEVLDYKNDNSFNEDYLFDRIDSGLKLTDKIEIIEDTPKEDKKIEKLDLQYKDITKGIKFEEQILMYCDNLQFKINEIIEKVNGE